MNPADTTRSGECAAVASVIAASQASRSGWSPRRTVKVGTDAAAAISVARQSRSAPTATTRAGIVADGGGQQ